MKNLTFRGGSRKTNIEGGLPKKRGGGLGQFADLRGGGVFEGRLIPNAHYAKGNRNIRYATFRVSNLNRFRMFC